jgi:hypothetical protein
VATRHVAVPVILENETCIDQGLLRLIRRHGRSPIGVGSAATALALLAAISATLA